MRVLLSVLLLVLAGCGFHPRGSLAVKTQLGPVQVVAADPYSPLAEDLADALERAGVEAAGAGAPASQLRILGESMSTAPLSVDQDALVREYVTRYRIEFRLDGPDGQPRLAAQSISLSRDYTFDSFASAGNPAEQELVEQELRQEAVATLLHRLDVALRPQP